MLQGETMFKYVWSLLSVVQRTQRLLLRLVL